MFYYMHSSHVANAVFLINFNKFKSYISIQVVSKYLTCASFSHIPSYSFLFHYDFTVSHDFFLFNCLKTVVVTEFNFFYLD